MPKPEPVEVEPFNPEDEGPEEEGNEENLPDYDEDEEEEDEEEPEMEELFADLIEAIDDNTNAIRRNTKILLRIEKRFSTAGMFETGTEFIKLIGGVQELLKHKQAGG